MEDTRDDLGLKSFLANEHAVTRGRYSGNHDDIIGYWSHVVFKRSSTGGKTNLCSKKWKSSHALRITLIPNNTSSVDVMKVNVRLKVERFTRGRRHPSSAAQICVSVMDEVSVNIVISNHR